LAFHLHQVGFGQMETRAADARLKASVICQQQQALRIPVQPACRIDTRNRNELAQRSTTLIILKLG